MQQRHVPADLSNIGSSSNYRGSASSQKYTGNAYDDDDDLQQRHVPADLSNIGSSSNYRSTASRTNEEELQRNSGSSYFPVYQRGGIGQNSYSRRQESNSETRSGTSVPAPIPVYNSVSLNSRGSSNSDSEYQETRTLRPVQPGQYVQVQARPGQTVVLNVPVRAGEQQQYTSRSEHSSTSNNVVQSPNTYKITYRPTTTYAADKAAASSDLERTRVAYTPTQTRVVYQPADQNRVVYQPADQQRQQPEKYVTPDIVSYGSYAPDSASLSTQDRYGADDEMEQVRVAPVQITGPQDSRYASSASSGNRGHVTNTRIVPASVVSSSSSSRTNAEREERTRTQSRPTYVYPARTTSTQFGLNSQNDSFGSSGSINSLSQTQNQRTGYTAQGVRIPTYSSSGSTREGSGVLHATSDDLSSYMSESQRLADQQSRQISTGSRGNFGVTNAESANRRTLQQAANHQASSNQFFGSRTNEYDLPDAASIGNNAYQQSWQKQSKWGSGSEYGTDGQPKTYSHLTTAESEKHKINGHEEGYKAATTTLENDGKVSTYSIRTP